MKTKILKKLAVKTAKNCIGLKLVAGVLSVMMLVTIVNIPVLAVALSTTTSDGEIFYVLRTADDLYWFAERVNSGDNQINAFLANDIVVNEGKMNRDSGQQGARVWTPIGSKENPFQGIFNGLDKKISGLYFDDENQDYVGLFGYADMSATMEHLCLISRTTVENSYLTGRDYVGGVAGKVSRASILSCNNVGGEIAGHKEIGGVVGEMNGIQMENCSNTGDVIGEEEVGGVAGKIEDKVKNCNNTGKVVGKKCVGGVFGYGRALVTQCDNAGDIMGMCPEDILRREEVGKGELVGGVVGYNEGTVRRCKNKGDILGTGRVLGGVVGNNEGGVYDCFNENGVVGGCLVGGIVGVNRGGVHNCDNGKEGNIGNSSVVKGKDDVGGIIGKNEKGEAGNCTNFGAVNGEERVGGIIGNNGGQVVDCKNKSKINEIRRFVLGLVEIDSSVNAINGENFVGGVVGRNNGGKVESCSNDSDVRGERRAGGVCGYNDGEIENCSNDGRSLGVRYIGGIVGKNKENRKVKSCVNRGAVCGLNLYAGGIVGSNIGIIEDCINEGEVIGNSRVGGIAGRNNLDLQSGEAKNCCNRGKVDGLSQVGGVVGLNAGTVESCKNEGKIEGKKDVGGVVGDNSFGKTSKSTSAPGCAEKDVGYDSSSCEVL